MKVGGGGGALCGEAAPIAAGEGGDARRPGDRVGEGVGGVGVGRGEGDIERYVDVGPCSLHRAWFGQGSGLG